MLDVTKLPPAPPELLSLIGPSHARGARPVNGVFSLSSALSCTTSHGQTVLNQCAQRVRATPEGARNDTLNKQCFVAGQLVGGGQIEIEQAVEVMTQAGLACELPEREVDNVVRRSIEQGAEKGLANMPPPLKRRNDFFLASSLTGTAPERVWLWEGLIPMGAVTIINGDGGTGKSLLALQLSIAVALDLILFGFSVASGPAVYIGAEDDKDEIHRRIDNICAGFFVTKDKLVNLSILSLAGEDALLAHDGSTLTPTPLYNEIIQHIVESKPRLVVLDTLADLYPANENDRVKVRQFVGMLNRIALEHECAVVLLAHPSLTGMASGSGSSGSTGWNNSARSRLYLKTVKGEQDRRILETKKANYGKVGGEITLEWHRGFFVAVNSIANQTEAEDEVDARFIELLTQHNARGQFTGPHNQATGAASLFSIDQRGKHVSKQGWAASQQRLLNSGKIEIVERKIGGRTRRVLEVTR